MLARLRTRLADDDGFGMAELGVYAALSVVILTICASVFISSRDVRTQVTDLTDAVSVGQLIANSVEEGVRNAAGPPGATDPEQRVGIKSEVVTAEGQLLRARVAVGAIDGTVVWQCQAWFYSTATQAIYSAESDTGIIADPVSFSVVGASHVPAQGTDHWRLLGEGIGLAENHPQLFGTPTSGDEASVVLYFTVAKNGTELLLIPTTVVNRKIEATGTGPSVCY